MSKTRFESKVFSLERLNPTSTSSGRLQVTRSLTFGKKKSKNFGVEKNFGKKIFVGDIKSWYSKEFGGWKIFDPKIVGPINFWVQKLDLKKFWAQEILGLTNFGSKKFWVQKNFESQKTLGPKTICVQKNFRLHEKFLVHNNFGSKKNFRSKKFWLKNWQS